jgi:hypothetical protein
LILVSEKRGKRKEKRERGIDGWEIGERVREE